MGTDDIFYYDTWARGGYKYSTSYGDYNIFPYSTLDEYELIVNDNFLIEKSYIEKLNEILNDVLLDFVGSGIRMVQQNFPYITVGDSMNKIVDKIIIDGSNKKTILTYDRETHEISGFIWMSLGDRDLIEITDEEVEIIRRALLIWIYENI